MWQSEWATDLICDDSKTAQNVLAGAVRHALLTETSESVLKYMARPLTAQDQPYAKNSHDVKSRVSTFHDGARVRHWDGKNSVKIYNEHNLIRVESTIHDPSRFKVLRRAQNEGQDAPKKRRPIRKGVADIVHRARTSQDINDRFLKQVEVLEDVSPFSALLRDCTQRHTKNGRSVRGLEPLGKDRELLMALTDHRLAIRGICNCDLRKVRQTALGARGVQISNWPPA